MADTFPLTGTLADHADRPLRGVEVLIVPKPDVSVDTTTGGKIHLKAITVTTDAEGRLTDETDPDTDGVTLVTFPGLQYLVYSRVSSDLPPRTFTAPGADTPIDLRDIPFGAPALPQSVDQYLADLLARIDAAIANGETAVTGVNDHEGPGEVTLDAGDVGALPDTWTPTWTQVSGKPITFPPSTHGHPSTEITGLGTAATHPATDFDTAGAAAAAQAYAVDRGHHSGSQAISTVSGLQAALDNLQPLDSDLSAIAGLLTNPYGRGLLTLANQAGLLTTIGDATEAAKGVLALATQAEALAGVNTAKAMTPKDVADVVAQLIGAAPSDLNEWSEIVAAIQASDSDIAGLLTAIAGKQAADATLTALAGVTTAADKLIYATGVDSFATTDLTPQARQLLDDTSFAAMRTTLQLGTAATKDVGTSTGQVAAGDDSRITGAAQKSANLSDLASPSTARGNLGLGTSATKDVGTSTGQVAAGDDSRITGAAQKASNLGDLPSASAARGNLGLDTAATHPATDFQTADAELAALAGLTSAADKVPYFTGSGSASLADLTAAARTLLGGVDAAAMRAVLGLPSPALDAGLFGWTFDPSAANAAVAPGTGALILCRIRALKSGTVNTLRCFVAAVGASLTYVKMGIFDMSGNLLGITAEQSADIMATTGSKAYALTSGIAVTAGTEYFVGILEVGTTPATLARGYSGQGGAGNVGYTSAPSRYNQLTGQATIPSTITPGSLGGSAVAWWMGMS